jgi:hypothetical protein
MFPTHGVMVFNLVVPFVFQHLIYKKFVFHTCQIKEVSWESQIFTQQSSNNLITIIKFKIQIFHKWKIISKSNFPKAEIYSQVHLEFNILIFSGILQVCTRKT